MDERYGEAIEYLTCVIRRLQPPKHLQTNSFDGSNGRELPVRGC